MEELLEELGDVEGSTLCTVEVVTVEVENLLPCDGEETAQQALFEPRAACDDIIMLIHLSKMAT